MPSERAYFDTPSVSFWHFFNVFDADLKTGENFKSLPVKALGKCASELEVYCSIRLSYGDV